MSRGLVAGPSPVAGAPPFCVWIWSVEINAGGGKIYVPEISQGTTAVNTYLLFMIFKWGKGEGRSLHVNILCAPSDVTYLPNHYLKLWRWNILKVTCYVRPQHRKARSDLVLVASLLQPQVPPMEMTGLHEHCQPGSELLILQQACSQVLLTLSRWRPGTCVWC